MQHNNEEIFMPYMSERKLGNLFLTTPEFRQNKELQDKMLTIIINRLKKEKGN